jgi:hypothetical protein
MDQKRALASALTELERIQSAMAGLSTSDLTEWRRELINLRRQLQLQITELGEVAERCDGLHRRSDLGHDFWENFAKMRTAVALHQARWPAVAIDQADPAYQQSIAGVRAANRAFVALAKDVIPTLSAGPAGA